MKCSTSALIGLLLLFFQADAGDAKNRSDTVFAAMDADGRRWMSRDATVRATPVPRELLKTGRGIGFGRCCSAGGSRIAWRSLHCDSCSKGEYGYSLVQFLRTSWSVWSVQDADVERHIAYLRSNLGAQADAVGFHVSRYPCARVQAHPPDLSAHFEPPNFSVCLKCRHV